MLCISLMYLIFNFTSRYAFLNTVKIMFVIFLHIKASVKKKKDFQVFFKLNIKQFLLRANKRNGIQ